ncbi:MAG: radical SAM protein [Pseudomonadota bacterium]
MTWSIVSHHRRLLAGESGTIIKDWGGRMPVALAFPNSYHAGMSNLGFQAVYGMLNAHHDVACERFFLPDRVLAQEYLRTGTPLLSLENQRPLAEFELIAFSLSHENDYPGIVRMLRMGGLAPRRSDRRDDDPLVLAGGVAMRTNPEPLADFLDLVLLGDGEVQVPRLIQAWREIRTEPLPRNDRVLHLAGTTPGAYAPGWYEAALDREGRLVSFIPKNKNLPEKIVVPRVETLPDPALVNPILTAQTEFAETRLVEIGRGCPHGCRFCLVGYTYRPPRLASVQSILAALGPPQGEGERVGLISPAAADHPELEAIIRALTDQGREAALSSLRVEALTPSLAEALALGRLKSAAIAPEAGTERLRAVINKNLSEQQILDGALILAESGVTRIKLYFMLGLPLETRDDVKGIVDLTKKIKDRFRRAFQGRKLLPDITLTLSSFTPKPFTPFESTPMTGVSELKARAQLVQKGLRSEKGVRVNFDVPKWAYLQTILSRGDRRVGALVQALDEADNSLNRALKQVAFNPDYFAYRPLDRDELRPWSFIDHGLRDGYLNSELEKAAGGRQSPPCDVGDCRRCGVCS